MLKAPYVNKVVERLYRVYGFKNHTLNYYYYRDKRIKQLAVLLHKMSWDDDRTDKGRYMYKLIGDFHLRQFNILCDLVMLDKIDEFVDFIRELLQERTEI